MSDTALRSSELPPLGAADAVLVPGVSSDDELRAAE